MHLQSEVFKTIWWFNSILQTGNHLELRFSAQKRLSIRKHLRVAHSNCFIYSIGCKPVFNYVKFGKITNIVYYIIYTSNVSTIYYMIWILHCWNQGRASGTWQFFHFILVWAHVNPTWNITLSVRHKFLHKGFCPSPLKNVKFSMVFICFHNIATVYT